VSAPRPPLARPSPAARLSPQLVDGLPLLLSRSVCDFELFGAVHHFGALNGGHYVALTPAQAAPGGAAAGAAGQGQGGRWHLFDDARVTPLERPGPALDAQVGEAACARARARARVGRACRAHAPGASPPC
jgi:hypothetical protein